MSGIHVSELVSQLGLEELASMNKRESVVDFMPAAVTGLADGDIVSVHPPYTAEKAELYGEHHYGDGRVAKAILNAAIENGMAPGVLYDFQRLAANYFTDPEGLFASFNSKSAVRIYPEVLTIDGNPLGLAQPPSVVIDYGACLAGRSYIADQIYNFMLQDRQPFLYTPLTRLPFTNRALMQTYDSQYGLGTTRTFVEGRLYVGREDGTGTATDEMIRVQRAHNAPADVADVILCTGAQHTTAGDLRHGIANAYTLLRQDGMLVIRSLARPASDEIGAQQIADWAFAAGFQEKNVTRYEAALDQLGALLLTGHFGAREIETIVIAK